ncbi:hypothetical protein LC609_37700, partial [Nostoc sp. XA013]|nr:hypothetical protein [Nostoc sp. XA013]
SDLRSIPDTIQLKHWLTLVPSTRGAERLLLKDMTDMVSRIRGEADTLIAELEKEGITHPILRSVRSTIETRAVQILRLTEKV